MRFLVDANVLSEATKPDPNATVLAWLREHERELVVNPIIVGEIQFGILLLPASKRRQRLEEWFASGVARMFCLPWDLRTASYWAALLAKLRREGKSMPVKDSLIAATALMHRLQVATRNERDFRTAGVALVNPFG